jgi:hypothetical protein
MDETGTLFLISFPHLPQVSFELRHPEVSAIEFTSAQSTGRSSIAECTFSLLYLCLLYRCSIVKYNLPSTSVHVWTICYFDTVADDRATI